MHSNQQQQQQRLQDSPGGGGGGGSEFGSQHYPWPGQLPSLHLYPLSDSFVPKQIYLPPGVRMRIGRQTNAKSVPGERNGYFDSKVLSRTHAEVWQEDGKVFIKDVKSSNGTFVNGERLSAEATESDPYELKSEDHLEFGIDIVGEDNKTVVHHKVSSKAYVVFSQADVDASARELQAYQQAMARFAMRRGNAKPSGPNVNDLTRQIANELQKSRETAQDLHVLHSQMNDIHDTLGGGNPVPSVDRMHPSYPASQLSVQPHPETTEDLASLRAQLADTQSLISTSVSRVISLEGRLAEQETVRREVEELRERLGMLQHQVEYRSQIEEDEDDDEEEEDEEGASDDDDTRSVSTVKASSSTRNGHGSSKKGRRQGGRRALDREEAEDEREEKDRLEAEQEDGQRGRPVTPEPGSQPRESTNGTSSSRRSTLDAADEREKEQKRLHAQLERQAADTQRVLATNITLVSRLDVLHFELDGVLESTKRLQSQHETALSTVTALESRVAELEGKVTEVEGKWGVWKKTMEETWRKERESWESERERMKSVVKEWEEAKRRAEEEEEERRLNDEEGPDDLGWMGTDDTDGPSGAGGTGSSNGRGSSSRGNGSLGDGNATIQGESTRFLNKHQLDRSGSPTPNSSPESKGRYSSLRHLLNPLYPSARTPSTQSHHARGSVPSSFLSKSGPSSDVGSSNLNGNGSQFLTVSSGHPLRKSASSSTIKGPTSAGRKGPVRTQEGATSSGDSASAGEEGSGGSLDDVTEDDERERTFTGLTPAKGAVRQGGHPITLTSTQLQGVLVMGFAVAIALNYEKLAQLVKS